MTYQEILNNARTCMGPYCKSCPTCNGLACKSTVPGPGAKGIGTGFIRNYQKWQELCVNMDTICENKPVDTSYNFFGKQVVLPVFAAPVGAMQLHYGDKYNDLDYNNILVPACAAAGIAAFTGDGTDHKVMEGAAAAITACGGAGIPTVKPWDNATVARKIALARSSGCFAMAMDIDAAGLPLLGVIPEDEGIPIALGRSALTVFSRESSAEIACRNIARRLTGERVPLMKLPRR